LIIIVTIQWRIWKSEKGGAHFRCTFSKVLKFQHNFFFILKITFFHLQGGGAGAWCKALVNMAYNQNVKINSFDAC